MGVPKFFRYISERYPCLSELAREQSIPDFDNLYLDMNGIIHNCSHPDDGNIHFSITEEDMFQDIFNYIDKLFFLIKPIKLFFMAVDGVAPRAKMNQQRSRRFRSAKDAELLEQRAKSRGEVRENERFDSNCITPGTEFMERLHYALRYFIKSKISADPLWQKCRVILSGHDSPGEGEHKIMAYIRYLKSRSDYDANTRHCLYGLDADLIILGLCTHELHFVVLREEVKFGRKNKTKSVEETRFFLLHLGLLREYLELEFNDLRQLDPMFDIAKLLDDWVLMGFLVGNDFIPHLPCLHISSNALPLLYKTYIKAYPLLGGNINQNGKLNLDRLETYFGVLSEVEFDLFKENYADLKYFQAKQSKNGIDEAFDFNVDEISSENVDSDLAALIESSRQFLEENENDNTMDEDQHIAKEFESYKRNYYMNKLNHDDISRESKRDHAIHYVTALQWILDYYYCGVQSWDWYYPFHYAPFISDMKNFKDYKINFSMGQPFLPFEQLLAVLPAASKQLLPLAYRDLMTSTNSKLIEFYPCDFETDLNGKKHDWEAVVLIPFLDENLLLQAMKSCEGSLTKSELNRNKHGPMLQYDYSAEPQESVAGIYSHKDIYHVFCTEKPLWSNEIATATDKAICIELPNSARTVYYPGFPTMRHLKYDFQIKNSRVKVFDQASRNESLVLLPQNRHACDDIIIVAENYLNQVVFIGWPHLIQAKVIAVSNKDKMIDNEGIKENDPKLFQLQVKTVQEHLTTRMGIMFNDYSVIVHARIHLGSSYVCGSQGKITTSDVWGQVTTVYPAQGVVSKIAVQNTQQEEYKKIEQLFPANSTIFFAGNPYFGSEGIVSDPMLVYQCGRLKVKITVLAEPEFSTAKYIQSQLEMDYVNSHQAAAIIGMYSKCLGRLTGSVLVIAGARRGNIPENIAKSNIGLKLKQPKQQEVRSGYARRLNNQWFFSSKAIELIRQYCEKFPMVIEYLSRSADRNEFCFEADLFPKNVGEGCVEKILAWVKEQDHMKADMTACGSQTVEKEAIEAVLNSVEQLKNLPVKTVKLQVKPHLLIKPDVSLSDMYKSKIPVKLFDRVIIVKTTYMVPLGAKGTVVGIYPVSDPNPVRLECVRSVDTFIEVLFDKNLPNGNSIHGIAQGRVYKVPETSVLLIQRDQKNEIEDTKSHGFINDRSKNPTQNTASVSNNSLLTTISNTSLILTTMNAAVPQQNTSNSGKLAPIKKVNTEFWVPSLNAKTKHARNDINNDIKSKIPKQILQRPEQNSLPKNYAPNVCQVETQILKNMLGLSIKNVTDFTSPNPEQLKQLPHPPHCWKKEAQSFSQQAHLQHHSNVQQTQRSSVAPIESNRTTALAPTESTPLVPINRQNEFLIFKPESLNQKGAFIPLQITRNNSKSQNSVTETEDLLSMQQNLNGIAMTVTASTYSSNDVNSTVEVVNEDQKPNGRFKKPRRVPKIGAKFDLSH